MCATAAPTSLFVLLVATLALSMMCGYQMVAEGLPVTRRVRGADEYEDILAGNDFLSVFLESTLYRLQKETTTVAEDPLELFEESTGTEPATRETREAADYYNEVPQTTERQSLSESSSDSSSSDGVIIAVHVSSSVGSQMSRAQQTGSESIGLDQNVLTSEEQPSLVANSGKSELNVEEPAPITAFNKEDINRLQNLPSSHQHNIAFSPSGFGQNKETLAPFRHSLIYHDSPSISQPGRARSVSYSTIIQDIQPSNQKPPSEAAHDRKERNYPTGTIFSNSFDDSNAKEAKMYTPSTTTTTSTDRNSDSSTTTTEAAWGKNTQQPKRLIPKIYGRPEQNYEVEEAVSVVTNGRTHGVQEASGAAATQKPKADQDKLDKDQKVGYVVEGRNYRKYRVEERTADGFIVGEYGVVSHDDGSLRGVRYTADGTINPRLIYDALMKFLAL